MADVIEAALERVKVDDESVVSGCGSREKGKSPASPSAKPPECSSKSPLAGTAGSLVIEGCVRTGFSAPRLTMMKSSRS